MAKVTVECAWCGKEKEIELGEYNFWVRRGREYFFCSRTCSAKFSNADKVKYPPNRTQVCEYCKQPFNTSSPFAVRFCSRECASSGSVTPARKAALQNIRPIHPSSAITIQHLLKKREAYKYSQLAELLTAKGIAHEFEFLIDPYIYDLALLDAKILIEFDGNYHTGEKQLLLDQWKSDHATNSGWQVVRIPEAGSSQIDASVILPVLDKIT